MSIGNKLSAGPAKRTRRRPARHIGVEYLEPRTVLSATQIVLIAIDPGALAGNPPPPQHQEPMFYELARLDHGAPPIETMRVQIASFYVAPWLLAKGPGSDGMDGRPPAPADKTLVASPPPSDAPAYSPEFGIPPEGEHGGPDRSAKEPPILYVDLQPPAGETDHMQMVSPGRSASGDQNPYLMNSQLAWSGLFAAVTATDWLYDAGSHDAMSVLDPLSSLRSQDESTEILPTEEEGGLVDIGIASNTLVPSDAQHAQKSPTKPETSSDEQARVAHDQSRQDPAPHQQEQAYMVDPDRPVGDMTRGNNQRLVDQRESATAGVEEEGGMIESVAGGEWSQLIGDEPSATKPTRSFGTIEVRMDAEVGFYQAFEVSTKPQVPDAQTRVSIAVPREER
jgi:hypothetical protein